jgi:hypothetical protein
MYMTKLNTEQEIFNLPVVITKQGKHFVAHSPALDISTSGNTEKDAKKKFVELVDIFLEEIIVAGTIEDVLSELGWKKQQKHWNPPQVISTESIGINLPVLA